MRMPAENLEPVPRDPKKLRRTALLLVGLMVASAIGILISYNRTAKRQAEDDTPAYIGRLDRNFRVWRQDESEAGLLDLAGDVFLISPVSFEQPESWRTTRGILEELKQRYAGRDDFHIVSMTVDPESESPEKMSNYAADLKAELPQWWLAGAQEDSMRKFLKNRLKGAIMPHEKDGSWVYDPSLVLVDRDRHLRQPTIRMKKSSGRELNQRVKVVLDFEQAARWDEEGRSEGLGQSNVETLRELLFKTIDQLLAKPLSSSPS